VRIERIRDESTENGKRLLAELVWEDRERPSRTIVIAVSDPFAADIEPNPDAFLVAALPLAQWNGEKRIQIEGTICCRLRDGLSVAMELFGMWYQRCGVVAIEPSRGFAPSVARREPRAASLLSGGIDALAALRSNGLDYPASHASSIRDCILLFGLNSYDLDADVARPDRLAAFAEHRSRLASLCEHAGATLISIDTNIRSVYEDYESWGWVGFGAGALSTALCLSNRIDRVQIGSAGLGLRQQQGGSHPWLDHYYSTEAVAVHQAQPGMSRFEKTRIVADWPQALAVLRSCYYRTIPPEGRINCGECDKCVRTMLALVALAKLDRAPTFPFDDVTPEMVEKVDLEGSEDRRYFAQCIDGLDQRGRSDLTRVIAHKLSLFDRKARRRNALKIVKRAAGLARPEHNLHISPWLDV